MVNNTDSRLSTPDSNFEPKGTATAIGSLPHADADAGAQLMIDSLPEAPCWPQLPKRSFMENMYIQYSRNMPGVELDEKKEKIVIDPLKLDELEDFYQNFLQDNLEYFALGKDRAAGFYSFIDKIKALENKPKIIKGQVTGPISFGLTVKQPNDQSILYQENYYDAIIKNLTMKARYQVQCFKKISPESIPLIFFDEPYLVSFGSAFVSLNKGDVIAKLNECFNAVDGMTGIHVCGGTDWSMVMETDVDVIHFDAFGYFESMSVYPSQLNQFLEKGGTIAWGITPHTAKVMEFNPEGLFELLEERFDHLESLGLEKEKLYRSSWVAPSCGTAVMTTEQAEKALKLSASLTNFIREKIK